jgi:tetratricopeptide (TPR) repeat protein
MNKVVISILFLVPPAFAQLEMLTGKAFDSRHAPIPGVKVTLQRSGQKDILTTETDSAGVYRFSSVPVGEYSVHAESKEGDATVDPVKIDKAITLDLVLQPPFFDEPQFTVAGVTDNTYRGGHGADTILRSTETLTKATVSLGSPERSSGNPLEAVKELQRAAELNPSEVNLFDWGTELLSHRAPQPAVEVFTKGVRLYPKSVRMILGLASSYYAAGSYEQATHCFFQATDLNPEDAEPYLFLAKVQAREITESDGYKERLARFLQLHPDNAQANYYAGLFQKAIALDPHFALAYLQLGVSYARDGRYTEAIGAYRKAIAETPGLEEAHFRLSEAYRLTGDKNLAQQELAIYNRLSKESAEKLEQERRETRQFLIELKH